jgi:hypothetical protein
MSLQGKKCEIAEGYLAHQDLGKDVGEIGLLAGFRLFLAWSLRNDRATGASSGF